MPLVIKASCFPTKPAEDHEMAEIRFASVHTYDSERRVAQELAEALPEESKIICNLYLPHEPNPLETDLIVITRYGITMIEVKDWVGPLKFEGNFVVRGEAHRGSSRSETQLRTSVLFERVKHKIHYRHLDLPGRTEIVTKGLIIIARNQPGISGDYNDAQQVRVALLGDGVDMVARGLLGTVQQPLLTAQEISKTADALYEMRQSPQRSRIGRYELIEQLFPEPDEEWLAERSGEQVRMKRRLLKEGLTNEDIKRELDEAERHFNALRTLQKSRLAGVPIVYDCFQEVDQERCVWTPFEHIDGASIDRTDKMNDALHAVDSFVRIASTLHVCHQQGVIHRALTPDCIIIPRGQQPPYEPFILHFDFARVPGQRTRQEPITQAPKHLVFMSPEVQRNQHDATPRSDQYSLGMIMSKVLFKKAHASSEDLQAAARGQSRLLQSVASIVSRMIESLPDSRYPDLRSVAIALQNARTRFGQ
jgi:serine/threonine protein kinase